MFDRTNALTLDEVQSSAASFGLEAIELSALCLAVYRNLYRKRPISVADNHSKKPARKQEAEAGLFDPRIQNDATKACSRRGSRDLEGTEAQVHAFDCDSNKDGSGLEGRDEQPAKALGAVLEDTVKLLLDIPADSEPDDRQPKRRRSRGRSA
ncbi:hypothetical protein MMC07_006399 [Pseudocyphellaria aurata]|nr:hypothetical protein [Pseudocyphellaria aurata]